MQQRNNKLSSESEISLLPYMEENQEVLCHLDAQGVERPQKEGSCNSSSREGMLSALSNEGGRGAAIAV